MDTGRDGSTACDSRSMARPSTSPKSCQGIAESAGRHCHELPHPCKKTWWWRKQEACDARGLRCPRDLLTGRLGLLTSVSLPRFAGTATFARLPQLHELRSMQAPSEGLLKISSKSELLLRFGKTQREQRLQATEELCLPLSLEDCGPLEIEVNGATSLVALWSLPNAWHRHCVEGVTVDLRLEKRYPPFHIAVMGVPFDSGCSYRPGARFGPEAIRSNSRLIRPYLIEQQQRPLLERQVVDTGDVLATPFNISLAVQEIYEALQEEVGDVKETSGLRGRSYLELSLH